MANKFLNLLLVLCSVLFCICIILGAGWFTCFKAKHAIDINDLSYNQVQILMRQYLDNTPGVLRYTWFEPEIGYTLKPHAKLTCWGDTFESNGIGYRTAPTKKNRGTYRILFLGDSWTYVMGVSETESFPHQFEVIANRFAGLDKRIQAWTLALPGYNTTNEIAALDAFYDQIQPNAVVLCPTMNDINSTLEISPQGNFLRSRRNQCQDLNFYSHFRPMDSYLYLSRWERVYGLLRETELRLYEKGVPFFLFFITPYDEAMVHHLVERAKIESPYTIVPTEYVFGKWRQSSEKFGHGTPEAYVIYAKIVYQMVAKEQGWKALGKGVKTEKGVEVPAYFDTPPGNWDKECSELLKARVRKYLSYGFTPGSKYSKSQCVGNIDFATGGISSGKSLILLRRRSNATRLSLTVRRILKARILYPLVLKFRISSPSGGTRVTVEIPKSGAEVQKVVVPIPSDIQEGSAIDLVVDTPRSIVSPNYVSCSVYVTGVEQN